MRLAALLAIASLASCQQSQNSLQSVRHNGFCVASNNADLHYQDANFGLWANAQACLNWCMGRPGVTACERIYNYGYRGCYLFTTTAVNHGNGVAGHECWIISPAPTYRPTVIPTTVPTGLPTPGYWNYVNAPCTPKDAGAKQIGDWAMNLETCQSTCMNNPKCSYIMFSNRSGPSHAWAGRCLHSEALRTCTLAEREEALKNQENFYPGCVNPPLYQNNALQNQLPGNYNTIWLCWETYGKNTLPTFAPTELPTEYKDPCDGLTDEFLSDACANWPAFGYCSGSYASFCQLSCCLNDVLLSDLFGR